MKLFYGLIFLIPLLANAAFAQSPMLAYDVSPPDNQCPSGPRNCYVPVQGVWGPVNPAVGGPSVTHAFLQFTLANTQTVEITFDGLIFLNAPFGSAYVPGIGIDGYDAAHLCNQYQSALTDDNTSTNLALPVRAICLISLPAGLHTIYAMEFARYSGVYAFRGAPNQALIVRFY